MKVTPISNPLPGERVLAVWPTMAPQVDAGWRRRLNLYTGRTLSDTALKAEQQGRVGRLTTLAQMLSPGVVAGLEVDLETAAQKLHVAAGAGLVASGEDVIVPRALQIDLNDLPTVPPVPAAPFFGVIVVEPVTVRRRGRFDPDDPCEVDESDDAFADEQDIDGCRLVFQPWVPAWDLTAHAVEAEPTATWRNRVAHHILSVEQMLPFGEIPPWAERGVPIAVLAFGAEGAVWVDRHSVVRQGGKAKLRAPLVPGSGNSFLWQARLNQFAEQLSEQLDVPMAERIHAYAVLPPAGMIPRDAVDLAARTNSFFPSSWAVLAVPLPLEEIDEVIARCAPLAPIATDHGERILLLVPVPQSVYEPRLLVEDTVDPIFQRQIIEFTEERELQRSIRMAVRRDYRALVRAIDGLARVPQYSDPDLGPEGTLPDADALPNEPVPAWPSLALAGGRFGVEGNGPGLDKLAVSLIRQLRDQLFSNVGDLPGNPRPLFTKYERSSFDAATGLGAYVRAGQTTSAMTESQLKSFDQDAGLAGFVRSMKEKLDRADDLIDLSFLKSHANIYRLRQHLLGNTASSRLATSPALAEITKGQSAETLTDEVNRYFYAVKRTPPGTLTPVTGSASPGPAGAERAASANVSKATASPDVSGLFEPEDIAQPGATPMSLNAPTFPMLSGTMASLGSNLIFGSGGLSVAAHDEVVKEPVALTAPTRSTVQKAAPIAGEGAYDFRTVSIAKRIEAPAASEAKARVVAARAEVVQALQVLSDLNMNIDDITIFGVPVHDNGVPRLDESGFPVRINLKFSAIKSKLEMVLSDPAPGDGDEASFFSESVVITEHMIATLRAIEGRVAAYRAELVRCEEVLNQVNELKEMAGTRLAELDAAVGEVRHKVATATALLADETQRISAINTRRQQVLREHLRFFAYVRPRYMDARVDTPVLELNPGFLEPPVPACLAASSGDVPQELEQMIQLLREAPVSWFVTVPKLLEKLDRVELLHGTLAVAKSRAIAVRDAQRLLSTFVQRTPTGRYGAAIARVAEAQRQVVSEYRLQVASLDLARFADRGWRQTREEALQVLSLGDLIESNHGRSAVADSASRELSQMTRVAGCLHSHACDVLPVIRLGWADRLSQFDESVNLRDLTVLPRWAEVDFTLRKEIQALTDWLYSRVDSARPDAVAWMHDLIRVCLLLASHASVTEILAGSVPTTSRATPGRTVAVSIDPTKVRLGMKVFFYGQRSGLGGSETAEPQVVAHGVVEDLVGGQARARIAEAYSDDLTLDQGTRARFVAADSPDLPTFARKFV